MELLVYWSKNAEAVAFIGIIVFIISAIVLSLSLLIKEVEENKRKNRPTFKYNVFLYIIVIFVSLVSLAFALGIMF